MQRKAGGCCWLHPARGEIKMTTGIIPFPAGVRHNNPLNIRRVPSVVWDGSTIQDAKGFEVFTNPVFGIRAGMIILRNYIRDDKVTSVAAMIRRWAPPEENPTDNYIDYVARRMGVRPTFQPKPFLQFPSMVQAMTEFENGWTPYSTRLFVEVAQWLNDLG